MLADTHCAPHVAPLCYQDPPPGCSSLSCQSDVLEGSQQACYSPPTGSRRWAKDGSLPTPRGCLHLGAGRSYLAFPGHSPQTLELLALA